MHKSVDKIRTTFRTLMIGIWAIAALLGLMVSESSRTWKPWITFATVSGSIILSGAAIAFLRRSTLDAAIAQIALTASFWNALILLPGQLLLRLSAMVVFPALGLMISVIAVRIAIQRETPLQSRLLRSLNLLAAACWNSLGALAIYLPTAIALNRYGIVG